MSRDEATPGEPKLPFGEMTASGLKVSKPDVPRTAVG